MQPRGRELCEDLNVLQLSQMGQYVAACSWWWTPGSLLVVRSESMLA